MPSYPLLFAVCAIAYAVIAHPGVTASDVTTSALVHGDDSGTNDPVPAVEYVSSTVSSIRIRWNATKATNGSGSSSTVRIEAHNLKTKMTVVSPPISSDDEEFTIPDLAVDAEYDVCIVQIDDGTKACSRMWTIPVVRYDTVMAVLLTFAFILLLILTAFICWRCAVHAAAPDDDEQDIGDNEDGNKVCNASPQPDDQLLGDEKAPLLVPGNKTETPAPNNEQQQPPTSLYLFLAGPALDYK
jgi:hypothetical protein